MSQDPVNVILIDPDDAQARIAKSLVCAPDNGNFRLEHVTNLVCATQRLKQGGVDVVLLEPALPETEGLTALESVSKSAPTVPVVIFTRMGEELALAAARIGAQGYLIKGEASSQLLQRTLKYAIERNRSVQSTRHLNRNIAAAQVIQQHLLPTVVPQLPGFDIAAGCFPAERCSGDFFDFIRMKGGLTVIIADVAGHGFGPAMLGAAVSAYLEAGAALHHDIHEMLTLANWLIAKRSEGQFVTLFSARIDPRTRTLVYCAAGHEAYLISDAGHAKPLKATTCPLGIDAQEIASLSFQTHFKSGDILLLMTDGVWEALSTEDQPFGIQRALKIVHSHRHQSAERIVEALHKSVLSFTSPQQPTDDVTMVVIKVLPLPPPEVVDDTAVEDVPKVIR